MRLFRRRDTDEVLLEDPTPVESKPKPRCVTCGGVQLIDVTCFENERREYLCNGCGHHQHGDLVA